MVILQAKCHTCDLTTLKFSSAHPHFNQSNQLISFIITKMHQIQPQVLYGSSYGTEPSSPNDSALDTMQYYSAPSSPIRRIGSALFGYESDMQDADEEDTNSNLFEFAKFQGFCNDAEFEYEQVKDEPIKRVDSLPTMAFADELFFNGQVKPLKLPPRLQNHSATTCPSPTMSPTSVINISFTRKNIWNDDFDPFMVALDKVREDNRGRKSVHRRSQSHSPFSSTSCQWPVDTSHLNKDRHQQPEKVGPLEHGLAKPKGSAYARWARHGSMEDKKLTLLLDTSPKAPSKLKGLNFRKKVRPVKIDHEEIIKPALKECKNNEESKENSSGDRNKMEKVKGILKRYASLRKDKSEKKAPDQDATMSKPGHLKNLSFKFRKKKHGTSQQKVVSKESKMGIIVPFKPTKLTLCLGYGAASPRD